MVKKEKSEEIEELNASDAEEKEETGGKFWVITLVVVISLTRIGNVSCKYKCRAKFFVFYCLISGNF